MSTKTSAISRLFNRIASWQGRPLRRQNARVRGGHYKTHQMEQLENRLALAVDVVFGPSGTGEEWIAVLADEGSDIYIKKDATSRNELRIADNSSFVTNLDPIENIDDLDSIYVFHGQRVEQQVTFPGEPGFNPELGLLPTTYESGSETLTFVLNTRSIRLDESVSGTIELGDGAGGTFSFRNVDLDRSGDFSENTWEVPGVGGSVNVTFGSSGPFRTITVNSPALALAEAGSVAMPMLNLNYSYDIIRSSFPLGLDLPLLAMSKPFNYLIQPRTNWYRVRFKVR